MSSSGSDEQPQRYFCHQCNTTCIPQPPEFLCPTCNEGFIEPVATPPPLRMFPLLHEDAMMGAVGGNAELRSSMDAFSRVHRHRNMDAILNDFRSILQESAPPAAFTTGDRMRSPPTTSSSSTPSSSNAPSSRTSPGTGTSSNTGTTTTSEETSNSGTQPGSDSSANTGPTSTRLGGHSHRIHTSNVSPNSAGMTHTGLFPGPGGTSRFRFVLGDGLNPDGNTDVPTLFSMIMSGLSGDPQPMVGNPGDYAWGPTGLDNIISQLIGQLDGSGPPPAQEQTIDSLPEVYVPKKHIENKLDCTVCQEYFTEDIKVKELPCSHYFHIDCIVPWLKLHNSCPICRTSIDGQQDTSMEDVSMSGEGEGMPDLEDQTVNPAPPEPSQPSPPIPASQSQTIHEDDLD